MGGDRFLSRQAYGLVQDTRQMSTSYRLSAKVNRLAAKLGAPGNDFCEPPGKPLGMRWRTYDRFAVARGRAKHVSVGPNQIVVRRLLDVLGGGGVSLPALVGSDRGV